MHLQMPIPSIPNQTTPETEASGKGKPDSATSDDIKKFSLTPFITELLNPTAKYLGEELKTFVKSKIEEKKKAVRGENLLLHLEALQDKDKADGKPLDFEEVSDLEFFDAWTEGAQDAPKSEPELFELWQSILHGVIDRKISEKYIIDKAKELSPADARLIGSVGIFGTRAANKDRHATLQRLESLGFLNRNYLALWIPAFIFSLPLLVFSSRGLLTGDDGLGLLLLSGGMSVLFFWGEIALGYLLFFTIIAIYPLMRGGSIASWHLSPLGKILVNLSTGKELVKGKKYLVFFHPTLSYEAVKVGISFSALFLGPIWVLVNKLWKVLSWQIGFLLL